MPIQVARTDTGQFVLMDPSSAAVVIDDDLAAGYTKLEGILAEQPAGKTEQPPAPAGSVFSFRGGPRYAAVVLAIVLPFVWIAASYFALANLLANHTIDRAEAEQREDRIDALERELEAIRDELARAPKPRPKPKPKPPSTPGPAPTPGIR